MKLAAEAIASGMAAGNQLIVDIHTVCGMVRPGTVIETGTYFGDGSTRAFLDVLLNQPSTFKRFVSIEVNPEHHKQAVKNICERYWGQDLSKVELLCGLSIHKGDLPKHLDIDFPDYIYTDSDSIDWYNSEVSVNTEDHLLMKALAMVDYKPDVVLLDSAGHTGLIEFNTLMSLVEKNHPFMLILDDINHRKHYKTMLEITANPARFEILSTSEEKFGHAIINVKGYAGK